MSRPRPIFRAKFYMITRRCTQRTFLLRPDDEINNAFLYCLIEAAQKFGIQLLLAQMMSNHYHSVLRDPNANVVDFYHRFHTHLAKCVNALRGRWENMWCTDPTNLLELEDRGAVMDRLVYTATNPVEDGLVEHVHQWPGPQLVSALLNNRTLKAHRPALFRDDGNMPAEVELQLVLPEELGDPDEIRAELRERIASEEERFARERRVCGRCVVGRRRIKRQSWRDCPSTPEPRRNLKPRVAARNKWKRIEALQRNRVFEQQYREALLRWRAGEAVVFPEGTYWLARYANVVVAGASGTPPPLN